MSAVVDSQIASFREKFQLVQKEIGRVIVGNEDVITGVMTCLLARGHVLLEGIPGVGKTKLVQTLADVLHLKFSRIQFTPDLMPGDIIGTNIVAEDDAGRKIFEFQPGPIFANVVLADEINRATPKTQSALLEAMQENSVSAVRQDATPLDQPFFVLATQNPHRDGRHLSAAGSPARPFLLQAEDDFPGWSDCTTSSSARPSKREPSVERVLDQGADSRDADTARAVPVARPVQEYAIRSPSPPTRRAVTRTQLTKRYVRFGSSPRGTQALILGAKVHALHERARVRRRREDISRGRSRHCGIGFCSTSRRRPSAWTPTPSSITS